VTDASAPSPRLPALFEFYIGGSTAPSLYVRFREGRLLYERASAGGYSGVVVEAAPAAGAWEAFWKTVERIGVWDWEPEYVAAHGCRDVTYWHLHLVAGDRRVRSRGANAYPDGSGVEFSKPFREFAAAVERLLGISHRS